MSGAVVTQQAGLESKYRPYPEYKDSGVEWLGEIPKHWQVVPIKYLAVLNPKKSSMDSAFLTKECTFVPMEKLKLNSIILDEKRLVRDVYGGYTYFEDGDVLMAKVTPCFENKNIAVASDLLNGIGFGSSEIYVIRATTYVNNRFLYYRLQEESFMDIATAAMTGAGGLKRVPSDVVNGYSLAAPVIEEQRTIAAFLDYETVRIDSLIDKQQRLIELLKEKRQAVISHAVTKGLNPNAPMKDSGVEWLGQVPEHWIVSTLKQFVNTINGYGFSSADFCDTGIPFIRAGNIKKWTITPSDIFLPEQVVSKFNKLILAVGDVVISMVGSDPSIVNSAVGQIATIPEDMAGAVPNQNVVILRPNESVLNRRYLFFILSSSAYRSHLNLFSHKLANQSIISAPLIVSAKIAFPTLKEQEYICSYLDTQLEKFERLVSKATGSLELLAERRTALISAAVTGKIDLRGWSQPDA
ncbi:restriction endonuclease subunit S [Shewanella mangrovisoli]|uniref:restriction endonuclease subunit S n=1 Tax=Shewanella mangrovisoli TaxID=2864211 RepID=UPI00313C882E